MQKQVQQYLIQNDLLDLVLLHAILTAEGTKRAAISLIGRPICKQEKKKNKVAEINL